MIRLVRPFWPCLLALVGAWTAGCSGNPTQAQASPRVAGNEQKAIDLDFKASDGKKVFARLYPQPQPKGVILMFHQAGSNREEYGPIVPRLAKYGFDCLTVDQRAGGVMWDAKNKTADQYPQEQDLQAAYPDLEGALAWAKAQGYKKILAWGSSYSASLSIRLAAEHPEITAVLAFSPQDIPQHEGETMRWNRKVKVRTLMAFTQKEALISGGNLYKAYGPFPDRKFDMIVTNKQGFHGSSTLRNDQNPDTNTYYWAAVDKFLGKIEKA